MTSCSCTHASLSLRRRTNVLFVHHHRRKASLFNRASSSETFQQANFFDLSDGAQRDSLRAQTNGKEEKTRILREGRNETGLTTPKVYTHYRTRSGKSGMFNILPSRLMNTDLVNVQCTNSELSSNTLCSSYFGSHNHRSSLRSAPFSFRILPSDCSSAAGESGTRMPNVSELKFHSRPEKGGESSWESNCDGDKCSGSGVNQQELLFKEGERFNVLLNNQWNGRVIPVESYSGRRAMSLSLLLDPIIGSPPSHLTSPLEARDDISALSGGFARKALFRRRLSTSFDDPSVGVHSPAVGSKSSSKVNTGIHFEPIGPKPVGKCVPKKVVAEEDHSEKKAVLNAWLTQIHEEALINAKSSSTEETNEGESGDNVKGSSNDDGNDDSPSGSLSHASKITENLFELLEKVIGFKGRNISHITVEQSVKDLCTVYLDATEEDKLKFFTILAQKYGVDHDYVIASAANLAACKDGDVKLTLEEKLRSALVPKSQWLFTQIARLENGVKFLVDLRTDLLDAIEKAQEKAPLKALNNSVRDLIGMWFNVGFLSLERVTWQSSCDMLQKISEYEAVHPMRNWTDLKKRVGPNRRCFVYTHNSMPGEPVVVLHTFLTDHIPSSVQKIVTNQRMRMMSLDSDLPMTSSSEDPESISTAAFYSITSTQRGLTGIELGNYLIKRVVRELQSEFPKMSQFSSLSPIPGFKNWLISSIKNILKDSTLVLLTDQEMDTLRPIFRDYGEDKDFYEQFLDLLKVNSWFSDERLVKELEKPLMRLCAQYLYIAKRRGYALDPVGHFHLKNGAVMWRINWLGDNSPRGLGQSCGMMVNYRYFLDDCETNSQNYMENQVIQISDQVKHLVKLTSSPATIKSTL